MSKDWNCFWIYYDNMPIILQSRLMLHGDFQRAWNEFKSKINSPNFTLDALRSAFQARDKQLLNEGDVFENTMYVELQHVPRKAFEKIIIADIRPEDKELRSVIIFELDDQFCRTHIVEWAHKERKEGGYELNPVRHRINKVRELYNIIENNLPFVECEDHKQPCGKSKYKPKQ